MKHKAYEVVKDTLSGCKHCGENMSYDIIDPEGVALGTSFMDLNDAEEHCAELNHAYELGVKHGMHLGAKRDKKVAGVKGAYKRRK